MFLGGRALVLKRPVDVGYVLAVNQANYEKTTRLTMRRGRRILGHGLFTAANHESAGMRRPVQGVFRRSAVADLGEVVADCADAVVSSWRLGEVVDLVPEMDRLDRDVRVRLLFGPDAPGSLAELLDIRRRRFQRGLVSTLPLPGVLPMALRPSARRRLQEGERELDRGIRERRQAPRDDLLSALVATGIPDELVRAEVMMIAVAGLEAVTRAQAWTLWALAEHREVGAGVRREVDAVLAGRRPHGGDWGDLAYTDAVMSESMRMWPPSSITIRLARSADRLPTGAPVRRGAKVLISPLILHHDPMCFPDPGRFDPGRFTPDARRARDRFQYLPFGTGQRGCIGRTLAQLETILVTALVAQRFELEPVGSGPGEGPPPPPPPAPMAPVRVRLQRRA